MKRLLLSVAGIGALVGVAAAFAAPKSAATTRLVKVKSPVVRGKQGHLVADVYPGLHLCKITVSKAGPSHALMRTKRIDRWGLGLYAKRVGPAHDGRVAWMWIVGAKTTAGRWQVRVSCGSAGSLRTSFRVVR